MNLGLRFILKYGSFLDVVLPAASAMAIVRNFETRHYHLKDIQVISGACLSGNAWSVNRDDVMAVHTAKVDEKHPNNRSLLSGNN